jgi:hypothetical protein
MLKSGVEILKIYDDALQQRINNLNRLLNIYKNNVDDNMKQFYNNEIATPPLKLDCVKDTVNQRYIENYDKALHNYSVVLKHCKTMLDL